MNKLAAFLALGPLAFGGMHRVWEVSLSAISRPPEWKARQRTEIGDVAFSPDGKLLAVTIENPQSTSPSFLIVIDVAAPRAMPRQYTVETCGEWLAWSPRGDAILVCGSVMRFPGGATCTIGELRSGSPSIPFRFRIFREFWSDPDRVVHILIDGNASIVNAGCQPEAATREEIRALNRASSQMPPGWRPPELERYLAMSVSSSPVRILAELQGDTKGGHPVLRRAVWDAATGREIAAWKPFKQPYFSAGQIPPPRTCALSPDGQFVAERSGSVVRLSRID